MKYSCTTTFTATLAYDIVEQARIYLLELFADRYHRYYKIVEYPLELSARCEAQLNFFKPTVATPDQIAGFQGMLVKRA